MASSSVPFGIERLKQVWPSKTNALPLLTRRCGAWAAEVSIILASALIPFGCGLYAQSHLSEKAVPLNPILSATQVGVAKSLALPLRETKQKVSPLTNLFWTGALVMPWVVAGWQLYLLAKTGKTLPKRWFNLQVVTASGEAPGFSKALLREGSRWGLPVGVGYTIWRYGGAVPDLGILTGLVAVLIVADGVYGLFFRHRCTFHDRLAGTFVQEADSILPAFRQFDAPRGESQWNEADEDEAIAALVVSEKSQWSKPGFWFWVRRHPGVAILIGGVSVLGSILLTFVGTQVYIQGQENLRAGKRQENERFLQLVNKFASDERRGAILALATLQSPDAEVMVLADLLSLESDAQQLEAISQALVSAGPKSLPYLHRLNLSLRNDLDGVRYGGSKQEKRTVALRLRTTQRAISKILMLYNDRVHGADLSRTNLGQMSEPARFNLVLDKLDLSGIVLKGAILSGGSFQEARFSGPGEDNLFGTFDDQFADLSGAELKEANLSRALLAGVLLNNTSLIRANLAKANLAKANLSGANLSSAVLMGASLREAVLKNARLTGADLQDASLVGANLVGARLAEVKAAGASFKGGNLSQTEWKGADLRKVVLSGGNLEYADFSSASLEGAFLRGAMLRYASFRDANLVGVDLRGANLLGADFQGALFVEEEVKKPDQFIQKVGSGSPSLGLQGVDFSKAKNLNVKQLSYICEQGGLHPKCGFMGR
ncbi:pentapeptide repeat-containing protein [Ancylothrix sp. C2]|uniref:pentapeptide repeat-containing protein n=1 Tax=Ancylothrix sp. D3o TaxID=2953691 RepID=UPI0021BA6EEC|nr:pentapeptide repeat-containing protein [Ancylothrix sp. D3o]MCT7951469.1 pentapeptide repeat-containing protein [Ancylothrix sp. D3o]